jgi:hypothetical protein
MNGSSAPPKTLSSLKLAVAIAIIGCLLVGGLPLHAELIVTIYQSGSSVVATYTGTMNTASLFSVTTQNVTSTFIASCGSEFMNINSTPAEIYGATTAISGPSNLGPPCPGTTYLPSTHSGDDFGFLMGSIYLPKSYVGGSTLSGMDTWDSTTISGLGLTSGTYTYTWGTDSAADLIVFDIAAVPEPASVGLLFLVLLVLVVPLHRRLVPRAF